MTVSVCTVAVLVSVKRLTACTVQNTLCANVVLYDLSRSGCTYSFGTDVFQGMPAVVTVQ